MSKAVLIKGDIPKTLIKMTGGMLVGYFAMVIFNLTDTFFVSRLGTEALAAMSFSFPVVMICFGMVFGVGIATSSVVSKAIGQGNSHKVNRLTTDALLLAFILSFIITLIGITFIRNIFSSIGASGQTLELVIAYMRIWFLSFPFMVLPMVANNAIRATGDAVTPGIIMAISSVLNILLDPILIFGFFGVPAMGIQGAAIATVLSRIISLFASFYIINNKLHMFEFNIKKTREIFLSWVKIIKLSIPSSITHMLIPITIGIVTKIISFYGDTAVAAIGVGSRIDGFALMIIFAISSAVIPFVGQNLGAKNFKRISEARRVTHFFAYIWGTGLFFFFLLVAPFIARIFSTDNLVFSYLRDYLRIVSLGYFAIGLVIICSSELTGLHKPFHATVLNAVRMFFIVIPFAWSFGHFFGVVGVFWGITLANFIGAYLAVFVVKKEFKRTKVSYSMVLK